MLIQLKSRLALLVRNRICRQIAQFLVLLILNSNVPLNAENSAGVEASNDLSTPEQRAARQKQLHEIVLDRLEFYAGKYPEIDFLVLDSAVDVSRNMQVLAKVLGQEPIPLDYEHPEALRESLLVATLLRIEFLLSTDAGSATLFKPGDDAMARRDYVCVISIDAWDTARDNRTATHHLLELPDSEFNAILPSRYLSYVSHLQFTLDHEIYHCLDTRYNGPQRISQLEYWDEYHIRKDEAGADAFGVLMNMARSASVTPYTKTLMNIRGLTLLYNDLNHYTYPAIAMAIMQPVEKIAKSDVYDRMRLATQIRESSVGNYEEYLRYKLAVEQAIKLFKDEDSVQDITGEEGSVELARNLVRDTYRAYYNLTGKKLVFTW